MGRNSTGTVAVVQVMIRHSAFAVLTACLLTACLLTAAAQAQTPKPPSTSPQVPPSAEAPRSGSDTAPSTTPPATSEQLSRSGGVIKPPENVDPKMQAPTPNPGPQSMPIVPPPGAPGGNPDVKPK